jgi:uncharacterized RDD family membrane protein YckC
MSYSTPINNVPANSDSPMRYASFQHRLGAHALDVLFIALSAFLLCLPWIIWSLVVWSKGQTPGKQILKIRVRGAESGAVASWGHMAVREFLVPLTVFIAAVPTYGIALVAWIVIEIVFYFTKNSRTLRDLWVKTAVINEA